MTDKRPHLVAISAVSFVAAALGTSLALAIFAWGGWSGPVEPVSHALSPAPAPVVAPPRTAAAPTAAYGAAQPLDMSRRAPLFVLDR